MADVINARLQDKQIRLVITDAACDFIVGESYTSEFGARPMGRYVERHIVTRVSKMMFAGDTGAHCTVKVDVEAEAEGPYVNRKRKLVFSSHDHVAASKSQKVEPE